MVEIKVVGTFATFAMLCQPPPTQTIAHHVASHSKIKLYYECMLQVYVASVYFKCVHGPWGMFRACGGPWGPWGLWGLIGGVCGLFFG